MMSFRCMHLSLVFGSVAAQHSWYKTITPSEDTGVCLALMSGSKPVDGTKLFLLECDGKDEQKWVFDRSQIRYGADEKFCVDAVNMTVDEPNRQSAGQFVLWDCNGETQQTWGYDADASTIYIADSNFCLDFWEGPPNSTSTGQLFHGGECNGQDNQKWSISDSADPVLAPAPAPALVFGSVAASSWYKTITPSDHPLLCLALWSGSKPVDGTKLFLLECDGTDDQKWVFDNSQIRYGADENFCVDALDMTDSDLEGQLSQLELRDCNAEAQQSWGYDADVSTIYIADSSFCLDFWEAAPGDTVTSQWFHGGECNGQDNQKWSIWDSADPASAPAAPPGFVV